jgi:hypothetical protein
VRCSRCGNDNPGTNRFCGMCGTTLLAAAEAQAPAPAPRIVPPPAAPPAAPIIVNPVEPPAPSRTQPVPAISGPSFLGLNQPAPTASSRNLDYLLEDEDEPKRGKGKIVLILVALALVVGLGYLRWRHEGLSGLMSGSKKTPSTQSVDAPQPAPAASSSVPDSQSPASVPAQQPTPGGEATPSGTAPTATGTPDAGAPPATTPIAPAASQPSPAKDDSSAAPSDSAAPDKPADTAPAAPAPKPRAVEKPTPATPAKPVDRIAEAEKYIYGRGVPQDCDRGLKLLRPAAEQSNPKAMSSLGALYSAGLCTPRDLPTAYRWFALSLRKQPDNDAVQTDLKKLWSEMTQPERQLAIKLSQ